jgi:hypothetical protein
VQLHIRPMQAGKQPVRRCEADVPSTVHYRAAQCYLL